MATHLWSITVVGCGGTGGHVAEGLCRLLPSVSRILLVDPDRVEPGNLGRQNFLPGELGQFKSEALAERLARQYRRPIAYSVSPIGLTTPLDMMGVVIGCVDNGPARLDISRLRSYGRKGWWVDAGNGNNYGQVLIGSLGEYGGTNVHHTFDPAKEVCHCLPSPVVQRPDLLNQVAPEPGCAAAVEAGEQSPTINAAMVALVLEVVRRISRGECAWMQVYLNLDAPSLSAVEATPEAVSRITGMPVRKLVIAEKKQGKEAAA